MKISELFTQMGSDKNKEHSYGDFYDNLTASKKISSILEIGVESGNSMAAWKEFDQETVVIGIDKDVTIADSFLRLSLTYRIAVRRNPVLRGMLRHGDVHPPYVRRPGLDVIQCTVPDFSNAIDRFRRNETRFDLIIDDASHLENDQILAFYYMSEFLSADGVFVIEDIQTEETANRFRRMGWDIVDLRSLKNRWDDVLAIKSKGEPHGDQGVNS